MSRAFVTKTSFTAGELDPLLLGRLDLKAQEDGAAKLAQRRRPPDRRRQPPARPAAGRRRAGRPATAGVRRAPTAARSWHSARIRLDVIKHGAVVHSITDTLWGAAEIADLSSARWGDRLLLCHPGVPPKELVRNGVSGWSLQDWQYEQSLHDAG